VRFPTKPFDLAPALQRVAPTQKAVPLLASRMISPGRGRGSLELSDLPGSPSLRPRLGASLSLRSPLTLRSARPYDRASRESQGFPGPKLGCLPLPGAGLLGLSDLGSLPPLQRIPMRRTIFSSPSPPESYDPGALFLAA